MAALSALPAPTNTYEQVTVALNKAVESGRNVVRLKKDGKGSNDRVFAEAFRAFQQNSSTFNACRKLDRTRWTSEQNKVYNTQKSLLEHLTKQLDSAPAASPPAASVGAPAPAVFYRPQVPAYGAPAPAVSYQPQVPAYGAPAPAPAVFQPPKSRALAAPLTEEERAIALPLELPRVRTSPSAQAQALMAQNGFVAWIAAKRDFQSRVSRLTELIEIFIKGNEDEKHFHRLQGLNQPYARSCALLIFKARQEVITCAELFAETFQNHAGQHTLNIYHQSVNQLNEALSNLQRCVQRQSPKPQSTGSQAAQAEAEQLLKQLDAVDQASASSSASSSAAASPVTAEVRDLQDLLGDCQKEVGKVPHVSARDKALDESRRRRSRESHQAQRVPAPAIAAAAPALAPTQPNHTKVVIGAIAALTLSLIAYYFTTSK